MTHMNWGSVVCGEDPILGITLVNIHQTPCEKVMHSINYRNSFTASSSFASFAFSVFMSGWKMN